MSIDGTQRRLAVVVCADVVGYSRHMARNEAETLSAIRALRDRVRKDVDSAGGRVVDAVGDAFLVEFASIVNATVAAAALTAELKRAVASNPNALELRIGIHVGDILEDAEGRLYGDAVNVAARIMSLAEPGGIYLSSAAETHLGSRAGLETRFVGEFEVKNLSSVVPVHQVLLPAAKGGADAEEPLSPLDPPPQSRPGPATNSSPSISPGSAPASSSAPNQFERLAGLGLPAIAVLPFNNMSNDPDQEYLADGLVEDLITALSCSRWFSVIARNSTFVYKGRAVSIPEVSRELGARYIVEGSIRRSGSRVRITGQLIDGATGAHLWAERYDREVEDLFDLQDQLTLAITGALIPSVQGAEQSRAMAKPEHNLDAWECLHRGIWHLGDYSADGQREACALFERASELAPRWGLPFAAQAWSHVLAITYGIAEDPGFAIQSGMRCAERAARLSPNDVEAQHALGWVSSFARQYDRSKTAFSRGIELNPSAAGCYHGMGFLFSVIDEPDQAIDPLRRSILLSPRDPQLHFRHGHLGQALFQLGRYDEAIREVRAALTLRHDYGFSYLLAAAYGMDGRVDEGRAVAQEARDKFPGNRVDSLQAFLSPSLYELHLQGLANLGLARED